MLQDLSIFRTAGALARHSAARQSVVSRNLANADTPDFKARDLSSFQESLERSSAGHELMKLRTSRPGHSIQSTTQSEFRDHVVRSSEQKPNRNTVFLETETLRAIEAERAHSRALAIYQSSLSILKTSIGRGR